MEKNREQQRRSVALTCDGTAGNADATDPSGTRGKFLMDMGEIFSAIKKKTVLQRRRLSLDAVHRKPIKEHFTRRRQISRRFFFFSPRSEARTVRCQRKKDDS
ncbi:hypothetical protein PUN28_007514 [Cardiocondyla obscurior]|uniref:Uncharacterized protein n=1 Tax=Cardiocondyla obscurior TaxID=286306 RepID=A0AAW2G625_9HYME